MIMQSPVRDAGGLVKLTREFAECADWRLRRDLGRTCGGAGGRTGGFAKRDTTKLPCRRFRRDHPDHTNPRATQPTPARALITSWPAVYDAVWRARDTVRDSVKPGG